jgi:hypothetical protein
MKVHIEENWSKYGVDIFIVHEGQNYVVPYKFVDGHFLYDENNTAQPGESFEPTFFIPNEFYQVLRSAMIGEAIDNDDALKDTRNIRDRLLSMIESEWNSKQLDSK